MKKDDQPSALPQHQLDQLTILEDVAYAAELFGRLETLVSDICRSQGIDTNIIAAMQERARRKARVSLAKEARARLTGLIL